MFRSFIYLDTDKLNTYKRQIEGSTLNLKSATMKKSKNASAEFKGLGGKISNETQVEGEYTSDPSYEYDKFEVLLNDMLGDNYFDLVLNDFDPTTLPAMSIMRINSPFTVPESFDMVNVIEKFKPMLMGQIDTNSTGEQEALESILGKASADVPIISEFEDVVISGKLNAKYLLEDYAQLEEYSEQDVFILCKVVGLMQKESVEIFDPLKDFIRLPRAVRRQTDFCDTTGLEKIYVEGPVLKVEIIAIYK